MFAEQFAGLKAFYRRAEVVHKGPYTWHTEGEGLFVPSSLDNLLKCFSELIEEGVLDISKPFVDAGSGDGRVVALANLLGFPAYGFENDSVLAYRSAGYLEELARDGVLDGVPRKIVRGRFGGPLNYKHKLGVPVEEVGTFFNYINNENAIARLVEEHASPWAKFLLYLPNQDHPDFPGLTHLKRKHAFDESEHPPQVKSRMVWDKTEICDLRQGFVHVYGK